MCVFFFFFFSFFFFCVLGISRDVQNITYAYIRYEGEYINVVWETAFSLPCLFWLPWTMSSYLDNPTLFYKIVFFFFFFSPILNNDSTAYWPALKKKNNFLIVFFFFFFYQASLPSSVARALPRTLTHWKYLTRFRILNYTVFEIVKTIGSH